jgi:hypothetical protein
MISADGDHLLTVMNLFTRIVMLLGIILLLFTLFPATSGTGYVAVVEDELPDDDISLFHDVPISWIRIPVHQLSLLLRLGISIFALFIVYLGGRSKARRFNDRTIDAVNVFARVVSRRLFPFWRSRLSFPVPVQIHI